MDTTSIIAFISSAVAVGSMILNWLQYRSKLKGTELSNLDKQLEVIEKLQAAKDEGYNEALKNKDIQIGLLKKEIETLNDKIVELNSKIDTNADKMIKLQNAVNKLIGGGCKKMSCPDRVGYPIEDLNGILDTQES